MGKAVPVTARLVAAGVVLVSCAGCAGVAVADPEPSPSPSTASASPAPASPAPAGAPSASSSSPAPVPAGAPKTTIDKDGTYNVGTDIVPGTYTSAGPISGGTCYWKRLGNPDGNLIDNALTKKAQVVQIAPTDKAFKTDGCQPWQQNNDAPLPQESTGPQVQAGLSILNGLLAQNGGQGQPSAPSPQPSAPSPQPSSPPPHS